jgi:hypothetical protein
MADAADSKCEPVGAKTPEAAPVVVTSPVVTPVAPAASTSLPARIERLERMRDDAGAAHEWDIVRDLNAEIKRLRDELAGNVIAIDSSRRRTPRA